VQVAAILMLLVDLVAELATGQGLHAGLGLPFGWHNDLNYSLATPTPGHCIAALKKVLLWLCVRSIGTLAIGNAALTLCQCEPYSRHDKHGETLP
jgi:hypothetical protein